MPSTEKVRVVFDQQEHSLNGCRGTAEDSYLKKRRDHVEKLRISLDAFVGCLVSRIFRKANVLSDLENFQALKQRLHNRLWVEMEKKQFDSKLFSPVNFENLDKVIYKDLLEFTERPDMVALLYTQLTENLLDRLIVLFFNKHTSKEPGLWKRFWYNVRGRPVPEVPAESVFSRGAKNEDSALLDEETKKLPSRKQIRLDRIREMYETPISFMVESLISRIFGTAKMRCPRIERRRHEERLFEAIWAEVEKAGCKVSMKKFKNLQEKIYRDFCKFTQTPAFISLMCSVPKEQLADQIIVELFRQHVSGLERYDDINQPVTKAEAVSSVTRSSDGPDRRIQKGLVLYQKTTRNSYLESKDGAGGPASNMDLFERRFSIVKEPKSQKGGERDHKSKQAGPDERMKAAGDGQWRAVRVDLVVSPISQFAFALLVWTRSKLFERELRRWAGYERSMSLISHALYDITQRRYLRASSEEEIFAHLGLDYIPPSGRNA